METLRESLKKVVGASLISLSMVAVAGSVMAEEAKPTADFTTAFYSQYIWRGFELSRDSLVIQPSMTIGYQGFAANLWGNLDTDNFATKAAEFNETDMTLSYGGSAGKVGYSMGYIYYGLEAPYLDSQEVYAGVSIDTVLKPSLTVYREIAHSPSYYILLSLAQDIPLGEVATLTMGGHVSYLLSEDADAYADIHAHEFDNFHDGLVSVALSIPVGAYAKVKTELDYSFPLSSDASDLIKSLSVNGDDDSFFYGGVAVSISF